MTKHCKLAGIVTGTPSKIPQWQVKYGIADRNVYTYENFDRIADNDEIDVVYIVTPTHLHAPLTLRAAAAGKHVWCEKPMAMHAGQCEAMIAACKRNKVALTIGYRMQHEPNTRRVIAMASENRSVQCSACVPRPVTAATTVRKSRPSVAVAFAVRRRCDVRHGRVSAQCRALYRWCRAAGCDGQAVDRPPDLFDEVDEHMDFTLEFPNAVRAECKTSFGKNMNVLRAECEHGWYALSPFQSYQGVSGRASDGRVFDAKVQHQQALQMDEDALAIMNGTPLRAPGEEGLRDIRIVDAIYRSAREGSKRIVL